MFRARVSRCLRYAKRGRGQGVGMGWVQAVAFSADSLYLVSVAEEDDARLWDCGQGTCIKVLEVCRE